MGIDVYGRKPTSECGKYFRNNVWWWRPLADYILAVAPEELTSKCQHWHTNDGDGLDAKDTAKLVEILQFTVDTGAAARYSRRYSHYLKKLPDVPCSTCGGTGSRAEPPNVGPGPMKCNGCDGKGAHRPPQTWYPFSVRNLREFIAFLRDSGGFEIN